MRMNTGGLPAREAAAVMEPHGIEPDLHAIGVALNVDVWRLGAIAGEKEATVALREGR
jgi:hypothetical protein